MMNKTNSYKNHILAAVIYAAVLAIYNVLIFLIFDNFNEIFWISYSFMTASFLANIAVVMLSSKAKDAEAVFMGIPLLSFSVFHVVAELFASTVFIIFRGSASVKLTVAIQIVLLLIFVIFAAAALLSKNAVDTINTTVKVNSANIKGLAADVQLLEEDCIDQELKNLLHKVRDAIYYSDPMTNESVASIDEMIKSKITELKYLCQNNNKNEAMQVCYKLHAYIKERNSKLMLTK